MGTDSSANLSWQRIGIGWFETGLVTGKRGDIYESDLSPVGRLVLCNKLFFQNTALTILQEHGAQVTFNVAGLNRMEPTRAMVRSRLFFSSAG